MKPLAVSKTLTTDSVAGMVGCMAAMEAIKIIAGIGQPLLGRLMCIDLKSMTSRVLRTPRLPDCSECGAAAS